VSSRDWQLRIHDILSVIQAIQASTADLDFEAFAADKTLVKSVLYDFIVIGEASANIPANVQD
jgi:uncharacterized protein with HEPN domain